MPMPSLALREMFKISKLFKLTFFLSFFLSFFLPLSPLSFYFGQGGGQLPPLPPLGSALVLFCLFAAISCVILYRLASQRIRTRTPGTRAAYILHEQPSVLQSIHEIEVASSQRRTRHCSFKNCSCWWSVSLALKLAVYFKTCCSTFNLFEDHPSIKAGGHFGRESLSVPRSGRRELMTTGQLKLAVSPTISHPHFTSGQALLYSSFSHQSRPG